MKLQELRKLIKEEIENKLDVKVDGDYIEIKSPLGVLDGFIDEKSKYRLKNFPEDDIIMFSDTIENNRNYKTTLNILKHHQIPYKIRKSRTDNAVRIMINITDILTEKN